MMDPQRIAADPAISAFVTANAGSGKTKTLIDRVARLLLAGASPEAILCVTYTKAAAAEMQRRLFERLGEWCVTPDVKLREQLGALEGRDPARFDHRELSKARGLFAKALETPGGLKIQTIHAFCEKLLRRFPLEAGVSPGFQVMDDSASAAIAQGALRQVATYVTDHDDAFAQAYARFSVALDFASFEAMFATFESQRGAIGEYLERVGGLAGAVEDVWKVCGFHYGPSSVEAVTAEAMAELDRDLWRSVADVLLNGTSRPTSGAPARCSRWRPIPTPTSTRPWRPCSPKEAGTPATWPAKTSGLKAHEHLRERLLAEQERLEEGPRMAARRPGGRGQRRRPAPGRPLRHQPPDREGRPRAPGLRRPDRPHPGAADPEGRRGLGAVQAGRRHRPHPAGRGPGHRPRAVGDPKGP